MNAGATPLAPHTVDGLSPRAPYLRKLVREHFPSARDASIVDLGCGHGALLYFAKEAGYRNLRGVDRSMEQVEAASRLGIENVALGNLVDELRVMQPESQDVVVTFDVIEHFDRAELVEFADGVMRALRRGGKWIIHTPNAESPFFGRIRYGDLTHEQAFTRSSITQLLKAVGFRIVACFEDAPVSHGLKSMVRAALWNVIRDAMLLYLAVETGEFDRATILTQNVLVVAQK